MARPRKKGLDYFPFDVDFFSDKKIRILKHDHGSAGVALYIYILCGIYKENGYYLRVDEDYEVNIKEDLHMSSNEVKLVMNFLLGRSLFDNKLFQSDKVLTSTGIQKRYQEAVKSRGSKNNIFVDAEIWILNERETLPFIKVTHDTSYSKKNPSYSKKNPGNSEINSIKKSKEKNKVICAPEAHGSDSDEKDERTPEECFQIIYDIYPKKVGRTKAFNHYLSWKKGRMVNNKRIKLTDKQIYLAVQKYIKQCEQEDRTMQFYKGFDTLMGNQLLDYVEETV